MSFLLFIPNYLKRLYILSKNVILEIPYKEYWGERMNCKNCGARIKDNAKVCPNCGAFCGDETGYVLLTADDRMDDFYSDDNKHARKRSSLKFLISAVVIIAIIGAGAYFYFTHIYDADKNPEVVFSSGSGIINGDEEIIYVTIDNNSQIEYIHGVSLYAYDKSNKSSKAGDAVSTDYQYTKSIDSSFRAIFFDTDDLKLDEDTDYTYTFEMRFSFVDSDKVYTYNQTVSFNSDITEDASDIIFDHSLDKEITAASQEKTTESTTAKETTEKASSQVNNDFIYSGYWFTEPYSENNSHTIFAIRFKSGGSYTSTKYYKEGSADWQISTYSNTFVIEDGYIVVNNGEGSESTYYKIDAAASSLTEEDEGQAVATLTNRKYNSTKNAEDFFGI